jgi:hypothetical protein
MMKYQAFDVTYDTGRGTAVRRFYSRADADKFVKGRKRYKIERVRRRGGRRRGHENPSTQTWLLIGAGVAAAGVVAYFIFRPTPAAAGQLPGTTTSRSLTVTQPQQIAARVGDTIKPPPLPALPTGQYWGIDPGTINTSIAQSMLRTNSDGSFTAVGPGTITIVYQPMERGGGVGGQTFPYRITVTA